MDWFTAFQNASNNMQTANAIRNQQALNENRNQQKQIEEFEKALAAEDPATMNDYGLYLYQSGNKDTGIEYLTKAAIKGVANALASVTWYNLKSGDHEDAVTLYKACRVKLNIGDTPYQLANCDSNYWLNSLAIGGSEKDAEKTWLINAAKTGHLESLFFPVVLAHKAGDFEKRDKLAKSLNSNQWQEIKDEMLEEQMTSKGWFKKWCSDSYKMIELLGH
jgi:TPR repeat protein